jgi:hypothetical protein
VLQLERDIAEKYGDPLPISCTFFAAPAPITSGRSRTPVAVEPGDRGEMVGAGVAAILRGVVCGMEKGVGEVVGFGDAIWLSGVVGAGNADVVVTVAAGFCW